MLANGDPYCSDGIAYIGATYKDPDGLDVTTEENSDGASTAAALRAGWLTVRHGPTR